MTKTIMKCIKAYKYSQVGHLSFTQVENTFLETKMGCSVSGDTLQYRLEEVVSHRLGSCATLHQ